LGRAHENFDEIVDYIRSHLPGERYAIVHGDFKFDNLVSTSQVVPCPLTDTKGASQVLHPTEPRVIGILDWELSTIGHPLMDVIFTTSPFWNAHARTGAGGTVDPQTSPYLAENRPTSGMPDMDNLLDRYTQIVGFDPRTDGDGKDWEVAKIFNLLRGGTISHGIQARTISGQASSDFSHIYFENTRKSLDMAKEMVRTRKEAAADKARL